MVTSLISADEAVKIAPKIVAHLGGLEITDTMFSCALVVLLMVAFALIVRLFCIPRWTKQDSKGERSLSAFRMFMEGLVKFFDKNAHEYVGHLSPSVAPWYFAVASLICLGTLIEVLGFRPPTADLSFTLTLGLSTFFFFHYFGAKEKKLRRFKRYFNPIMIITDSVIPVSMALRLFGSVFSGYLIMHLIYSLGWGSVGINAVGTIMFTVFHALIQSYVFFLLSMCFIAEAVE